MSVRPKVNVSDEAIAEFCQRWKVVELGLFGSAARGELLPDSDVDVLVTFAPDAAWSLFDFVNMQEELRLMFRRDVDLVERAMLNNPFRRRSILRDLVVLYAA